MTDGLVQVQPDSTGAKIDTSEITRDDDVATMVDRQRVVLGDDKNRLSGGLAEVREQKLQTQDRQLQLLERIDNKLERLLMLIEGNL